MDIFAVQHDASRTPSISASVFVFELHRIRHQILLGIASVRLIQKSKKLADVCYDIRGPVLEKAKQMEDEGHKIIKLNIGNLAVFGFDAPDEIVRDMILNMGNAAGYTDSKGMFAPRKAIMHYTQEKKIAGVTIDD